MALESEDIPLGPFRASGFYSYGLRMRYNRRTEFFVTMKYWGQTGVSPLVLSARFNLIKFAYTATSEETSFRKHKSTWGASNHNLMDLQAFFELNAILENYCWMINTTFSSCYVRDMSTHTGDLFSLGPLLITGDLIASPTLWLLV